MRYRGVIQKGDRRASQFGFPTINIALTDGGLSGIYAGVVRICGETYHAAIYADHRRHILEAHLEKYSGGELYGRVAEIELLKKIREDKKFDVEEELRAQIAKDVQSVRDYFRKHV
jgi:riboflavin kinase/FMN adenylyltransferase